MNLPVERSTFNRREETDMSFLYHSLVFTSHTRKGTSTSIRALCQVKTNMKQVQMQAQEKEKI